MLVIGTLAIGTLATGIGIANGQEAALDTKSAIFVGGNARLDTDSPIGMGTVADARRARAEPAPSSAS